MAVPNDDFFLPEYFRTTTIARVLPAHIAVVNITGKHWHLPYRKTPKGVTIINRHGVQEPVSLVGENLVEVTRFLGHPKRIEFSTN